MPSLPPPRPATRPLPSHPQSIRRWLPHLRRRPNTPVASFPFQGACLLGTWLPLNGPLLLLAALTVRLAGPITHFIPPDPALHMHLHGGSLYSLHSLDWAPQPNLAIPGSLSSAFLVPPPWFWYDSRAPSPVAHRFARGSSVESGLVPLRPWWLFYLLFYPDFHQRSFPDIPSFNPPSAVGSGFSPQGLAAVRRRLTFRHLRIPSFH